jgi:hypothetical protein
MGMRSIWCKVRRGWCSLSLVLHGLGLDDVGCATCRCDALPSRVRHHEGESGGGAAQVRYLLHAVPRAIVCDALRMMQMRW